MITIIFIALGGACGAIARYGINSLISEHISHAMPWGTLCVNVVGATMMGAMVAICDHFTQLPMGVKPLIITGFLGAFTTFSAFSADVIMLWERETSLYSMIYIAASVTLSIIGLYAALQVTRTILS